MVGKRLYNILDRIYGDERFQIQLGKHTCRPDKRVRGYKDRLDRQFRLEHVKCIDADFCIFRIHGAPEDQTSQIGKVNHLFGNSRNTAGFQTDVKTPAVGQLHRLIFEIFFQRINDDISTHFFRYFPFRCYRL